MRIFLIFFFLIVCRTILNGQTYQPFNVPKLGKTIYEGVFTGNGLLGTMTMLESDSVIKVEIGRTDVYDHRQEDLPVLFGHARLPVGHFEIRLKSAKIMSAQGQISIDDANAVATFSTNQGKLLVTATTITEQPYMLLEIDRSDFRGIYEVRFVPGLSQSPRAKATWIEQPVGYQPNPMPRSGHLGDVYYIDQRLMAGGGYATTYKVKQRASKVWLIATITYNRDKQAAYLQEAIDRIQAFSVADIPEMYAAHKKWWQDYMAQGSYQIPDTQLQNFYNLQMYKLGCLTRSDKPAIDLQGPWTGAPTPWPAYWFNLNLQLSYSPLYTANRLNIASSLIHLINRNVDNLKKNIPEQYRKDSYGLGRMGSPELLTEPITLKRGDTSRLRADQAELSNLTWLLYYYYLHYRYSMEDSLKRPLYQLLKGSINYALHLMAKNDSGQYAFIVPTNSPEYSKNNDVNNNYDLSALQWGINTLQELGADWPAERQYLKHIRSIQSRLIDYPKDEHGFRISTHQAYNYSHRHYSHLMMIYPYYLINADQPENIALIRKSIAYWQSKPSALQGYSLSGAGSMYAMLGDGDVAIGYLKKLHDRFIQPNTLYKETGPVIETPLALAASLQELSLQFWNKKLRVFPAVPSGWKNVSFRDFRTDGAFLVSADLRMGVTKRVEVKSENGGDLWLQINQPMKDIRITGLGRLISSEGSTYHLKLPKGTTAVFTN